MILSHNPLNIIIEYAKKDSRIEIFDFEENKEQANALRTLLTYLK